MKRAMLLVAPLVLFALAPVARGEEKVGERPYEMVWAGRDAEVREPLVDFENLDGWRVDTKNAVASFERSREEQMYGKYVGKLTYRKGDGTEAPVVAVRPPEPIPIPNGAEVDALSCWVVGNNWGWTIDPKTPQTDLFALFKNAEGKEVSIRVHTINWKEWFLCYCVFGPETRKALGEKPTFDGFRLTGGTNEEDRTIYFDSLCVFKEDNKPLEFSKRAKPGIDLFEGQDLGVNNGEGRLPFPTREDTILPESSQNLFKDAFHFYGDGCDFAYEGTDGTLEYFYNPKSGTWSDVAARYEGGERFYPCAEGGVNALIGEDGSEEPVESRELASFGQTSEGVKAVWNLKSKSAEAKVEYRFKIKGKSLIVDTIALGGKVPSVSAGRLENVSDPRVFAIPYYLYDYGRRPGVATFRPIDAKEGAKALFASANIDWYRSSASYLSGKHGVESYEKEVRVGEPGAFKTETQEFTAVILNGSADYRAKTDGTRNDVYERFIFTISPDFDETLPSIPNPKSPYREVAGKGVWRAHGATTRDADKAYWRNVWRYGMRHMIITDHEVCWRDEGESFTFRTKPAPKKGGDAGWFDYCRFMQDELGFVYGPYNNFTDFSPVNEYWSPDMINRLQDGSLQNAWMRCYAPKPIRAVEYCEKLTPINEEKFHFSCAYCDVHSSVPPWTRTDYDPRVPGAGTFMSVFYPYGEIFLLQKRNWDGPTYSEGPHHCFYAGLTDGNYAQDQPYNMFKNPWLLDFDLLKIHPQEVDFGMGNLGMFAPGYAPKDDSERSAFVDRFLAATLAFGHSGFYAADYGMWSATRSYYMVQQIASRYTQTEVESIRYFDEEGNELATSDALDMDVVKRSQVCVRYKDGTVVVSNGSTTDDLVATVDGRELKLPPNGYVAWTSDGAIAVESTTSDPGARYDYCESPEYVYIDGRGSWVQRPRACGSAQAVLLQNSDSKFELIPITGTEVGFKLGELSDKVEAVALDKERKELGSASVKRARGFVYVEPVEGAFSYELALEKGAGDATEPKSDRFEVAPGEKVAVEVDGETREIEIPLDAELGRRIVDLGNGNEIDFLVVAPVDVRIDDKTFGAPVLVVKSNVPKLEVSAELKCEEEVSKQTLSLEERGTEENFFFFWPVSEEEGEESGSYKLEVKFPDGSKWAREQELTFVKKLRRAQFVDYLFDDGRAQNEARIKAIPYVQLRGKEPKRDFDGTNATNYVGAVISGGVTKSARFVHPPYGKLGTGRVLLRYDFDVPGEPTVFSLSVGRKDGSDAGDGVKFQIAVAEFDGNKLVSEKTLAEKTVVEFKWDSLEADLSDYAGQSISLLVVSDPGDKDDSTADWGAIAEMKLETSEMDLIRTVKE